MLEKPLSFLSNWEHLPQFLLGYFSKYITEFIIEVGEIKV